VPIVGLDGGVGLPGYSGLLPNPMLAHSLVSVRDLLLSGSASQGLSDGSTALPGFPATHNVRAVKALQPNVRVALAEQETLEGLAFQQLRIGSASLWAHHPFGPDGQMNRQPLFSLTRPDDFGVFKQQITLVHSFADLRSERIGEILSQVVPQTAYWTSVAGLNPERHKYTLELLGVGLRIGMLMVMRFKQAMQVPRPAELSALVQPVILTPGYTAYPSGHATEAYLAAELLAQLGDRVTRSLETERGRTGDPARKTDLEQAIATRKSRQGLRAQLNRLAYRVAENRVVAGLHYPIDALPGQVLGIVLARYLAGLGSASGASGELAVVSFNALSSGFDIAGKRAAAIGRMEPELDSPLKEAAPQKEPELARGSAPVLGGLWHLACQEWSE
jgi:membrane-associated phospholipid phosphatase